MIVGDFWRCCWSLLGNWMCFWDYFLFFFDVGSFLSAPFLRDVFVDFLHGLPPAEENTIRAPPKRPSVREEKFIEEES